MKKVRYAEGNLIAIPIGSDQKYVRAVVARMPKRHRIGYKIILLYAFPRDSGDLAHLTGLPAPDAQHGAMIVFVGDRKIAEGGWPLIGSTEGFDRRDWP